MQGLRKELHVKEFQAMKYLPAPAHMVPRRGYVDDKTIDARIKAAFVKDDEVKARDIHVKTYKGVVQLSGFVETESQASRAAEIALATPGVRSVKNDIQTQSQR
jgi:osmotically-inducible protein OsmY